MTNINTENIELSSRQLKAMLYVARYKNLTQAANKLNRSQTAITKAVGKLEDQLGVRLFDRSSVGMTPTVYGEALAKRVANAEAELFTAGDAYRQFNSSVRRIHNIPLFTLDLSYKRLASFLAVYDTRGIAAAANELKITRSAIYSSIRQLEELLESKLFERDPSGMTPTTYCHILARHVKLAFAQFRHGLEDIAKLNGVMSGKVVVGTLPYTRTIITPRAINRLLKQYPQISLSTREGPYAMQEALLRSGEIDLIIGATRTNTTDSSIATEVLLQDQLALIVRKAHPFLKRKDLKFSDLQDCGWVLPAPNTPARQLFDHVLSKHRINRPALFIESSSLITIRGLLLESDFIALLSEHQIYYDKLYGQLTTLPLSLTDTVRPIGVTTNAHVEPSPAAKLFLESLRDVVNEWNQKSA
ncbi:MAG: LysR family transcriptional regulator [Gammaproteobacteria bacterium]|nr:LysR family transcriptional regulator [Gammaproteobacteria bacterium]